MHEGGRGGEAAARAEDGGQRRWPRRGRWVGGGGADGGENNDGGDGFGGCGGVDQLHKRSHLRKGGAVRARGGCEAGGGCSWRTCNALPAAATCRGSAALPPWSPALRTHTSTQNGEVRACGLGEFRGVAVQGRMLTCHAAYLHRPSARAAHCRCVTCTPSQREQAQGARTAKAMITTNAAASRCTLAATRAAAMRRASLARQGRACRAGRPHRCTVANHQNSKLTKK